MMMVVWNTSTTVNEAATNSSRAQEIHGLTLAYEMAAQRMNAQVRGYVITTDDYYAGIYKEANGQMAEALAKMDDLVTDPADRAKLVEVRELKKAWEPLWATRLMTLARQGRNAEAMSIIRANNKIQLLAPVLKPLRAIRAEQLDLIAAYTAEHNEAVAGSRQAMLIGGILLMISVIGLCVLLTRSIGHPIKRLTAVMNMLAVGRYSVEVPGQDRGDEVGQMAKAVEVFRGNGIAKEAADAAKAKADNDQKLVVETVSEHLSDLSKGDLTAAIVSEFPPEYVGLKSNFNEALVKLRDLIGAVSESARAIRTGSGEIAQASEDLARRTESNAAGLEETAAAVTQMDTRLRTSADAAARTVERADQAIATVDGGRVVAEEAVQAMGRVSESAKGIDSVIEGLDKIAFQTRVLAMNAAVEAGRAGDAGRGFAVVADLVSALAMRAEEEAKRARDQLTVTQTDIGTAVLAVTKVDGALSDISGDVSQVHELLATMATDNQAQSAAITQISSAIGTMDQSTQQNAAMVEETSAAARNLATEVGHLAEQAGRFTIGQGAGPVSARSKPDYVTPGAYTSPIKPLPAAAIPALVRSDDDWNSF
ncbi:methyl-accepting chemotaxis protein [Sphingomonas aliaeris]|uniref:Methyl-accepting chemotaxis protein n=2 Tax=Sphingomonas aliaeris TaxID=2759526 RepID=A0A974NY12_9SPHN|nr:methyl-accepting chemotaxis protein [Sphingomonas aliaeris]